MAMTFSEAQQRLAEHGHRGRAADAAAWVFAGRSRTQASKDMGVDIAATIRLLNKFTVTRICPCCGHIKKELVL